VTSPLGVARTSTWAACAVVLSRRSCSVVTGCKELAARRIRPVPMVGGGVGDRSTAQQRATAAASPPEPTIRVRAPAAAA
jgi:hypothetical protein